MKKKYVTYTSTMESKLMEDITEYAKKKKLSKNKVVEEAVKNFLDEEIKKELSESFRLIAKDEDMVEMAEWGLEDYVKQLNEWENESKRNLAEQPKSSRRK